MRKYKLYIKSTYNSDRREVMHRYYKNEERWSIELTINDPKSALFTKAEINKVLAKYHWGDINNLVENLLIVRVHEDPETYVPAKRQIKK